MLALTDDAAIAQLVKRHAADEVRHAELFQGCVRRTGVEPPPVPEHLKVIDRLDRALGGLFDRPITDRSGVMEAYLVLQVVEERAVTQFAISSRSCDAWNPSSADVLVEVGKDEERHLKYCRAIVRRFAPDAGTAAAKLSAYREIEARVYAENSLANLSHVLEHGVLDVGPLDWLFWQGIGAVGGLLDKGQPTPFRGEASRGEGERELAMAA